MPYKVQTMNIVPYVESRDEKYSKFVEVKFQAQDKPKPVGETIKSTNVVYSSLAGAGQQDPRGMTEEAKAWLRQVHRKQDAEKDFWGKAPTQQRMWNDPEVPDDAFAADYNISKKTRVDKWRQ